MANPALPSDFTAIDLETANTDPHSICEIGVARFRSGELIEVWRVLVNPEAEFGTTYHSDKHGIRDHHVRAASTFAEVYPMLQGFLAGETCIYHSNSRSDINCISKACARYGLDDITLKASWLSTQNLANEYWPEETSYKLELLCKKIGYEYVAHNALDDAMACAEIFLRLSGYASSPTRATAPKKDGGPRTYRTVVEERTKRRSGLDGDPEGRFAGTHIIVTGKFSPPWNDRDAFEDYLCTLGFTCRHGFTGKTNILVIGEGAGPAKIKRARSDDTPIMTEAEFLEYISDTNTH